jgi:hypothetical protein
MNETVAPSITFETISGVGNNTRISVRLDGVHVGTIARSGNVGFEVCGHYNCRLTAAKTPRKSAAESR